MSEPFFSIITPAYNGMKYIRTALDSVLGQSFDSYEFIIVDDGSTDGTRELLGTFKKNDNVKIILLEKNGGIGNARNAGIRVATGRYLLFLDQDDFFAEGMLRTLHGALNVGEDKDVACARVEAAGSDARVEVAGRTGAVDVLCFGMNRVDEDGRLIKSFPPELEGKALRWDLCTVWTYAVRRALVVDNGIEFPVDSMNEDLIFSLQVARYANVVEKLDDCLYNYRINELSTSKSMAPRFERFPESRRLVFMRCREAYDYVSDEEDRCLIFLTALAYYYSIQFGIFRRDDRDVRLREYRLHRAQLERYFGDYLHGHRVTLFRPHCRRFIYRLVVWVSYRMEKYLGQAFFEWFMLKF